MKIWTYKKNSNLLPATSEDKDKIGKLPKGEPFMVEYKRIRNPRFHRKMMAFFQFTWEHKPEILDPHFPTSKHFPDEWRKEIIKRAGYYTHYVDFKGNDQYNAKSMAFGKMSQNEAEELFSACLDVAARFLDLDKKEVENEFMSFT